MRNSLKVIFTSVAILAVAAFLIACGSPAANNTANTTNTTNRSANNSSTTTPTNTTPANSDSNSAANTNADEKEGAETAEKIGVPECDDYIAKYEACISSKVPAAQRATFESSFKTMRDSWAEAAKTEAGKSGLAAGCKAAMDSAKTSLSSFGCEW